MNLNIVQANLNIKAEARHVLFLTNTYALDKMGGGKPLSSYVQEHLIDGLKAAPNSLIYIAYIDNNPVGIATCFIGYSTFYAKNLINIHDLSVIPKARGMGVGKALIKTVIEKAKELNCCKITLEVLENNPARNLYEREGFEYGEQKFLFMTKLVVDEG
ncbi:MAG: GNAT family N-acetyltransferase [Balneolaceae bacterium]